MSKPAVKSIGTRILLYTVLISFVSIIITGTAVLILAKNELGKNIAERNLQIAKQASSEISLYINDSMSEMKTIGEIIVPLSGNPYLQQIVLENLTLNNGRYREIHLTDLEGNSYISSNSESSSDWAFPEGFLDAVAENGRGISAVELSEDGLPCVVVGLLIPHPGPVKGMIAARLNLRDIWEIIDSINVGTEGRASLFTGDGTVISHFDKQQVFKTLPDDQSSTLGGVPPEGMAEIRENESARRILSVYAEVPEAGWIIRIDQPVEEAFLPQRQIFLNALILILIGIILAYISSILIAKDLSEPLKQLVEGTKKIGSGNFDYRLKYDVRDEIGMLAEAFNEMAGGLKTNSRALRKSEERYRIITENSSDIVFTLDDKGCFTFLNSRAEDIAGYDRNLFLGNHLSSAPIENYSARFLGLMKSGAALSHLTGRELEVILSAKDDSLLILDVRLVRTTDDTGKILFLGFAHDVTEKRKMQQNIVQSEKLSSLGYLVAGVAHELNNPLTSVLGYAELLRSEDGIAEPIKQDLEKIIFESTRAKRIIQNLLVFARKNPPSKEQTQINDVVENVLLVREFEMSANRIEVERMLDPQLPRRNRRTRIS